MIGSELNLVFLRVHLWLYPCSIATDTPQASVAYTLPPSLYILVKTSDQSNIIGVIFIVQDSNEVLDKICTVFASKKAVDINIDIAK